MEDLEGLRILVTGGGGFVGANLALAFSLEGCQVTATVRPATSEAGNWRTRLLPSTINCVELDITDRPRVRDWLSRNPQDVVVHTAAHGAYSWQTDDDRIFGVNVAGTMSIIESAFGSGASCVIYTGSSSEYGLKNSPMQEDMVLVPRTNYGVSKAAGTLFAQSYGLRTGRCVFGFRLFSPYGPFEEPRRLIPTIVLSYLKGKPIMLSSPNSVRDFVFIDDVAKAFISAVAHRGVIPPGDIMNLGSGRMTTVFEVVRAFEQACGSKLDVRWGEHPSTDVPGTTTWVADITKVKGRLGWTPQTGLVDGLRRTLDWFRQQREVFDA